MSGKRGVGCSTAKMAMLLCGFRCVILSIRAGGSRLPQGKRQRGCRSPRNWSFLRTRHASATIDRMFRRNNLANEVTEIF